MKLKFYIPVIGLSVISVAPHACINTYAFELGYGGLDQKTAQRQLAQGHLPKTKSVEDLNDYGVLLIYAHQFDQAIKIFQHIEKSHPNLAKTAANLGTAYELAGQSEKAKYWIEQDMQRDPNIHRGSEWIHVKILDAKIQQQKILHGFNVTMFWDWILVKQPNQRQKLKLYNFSINITI